MYVGPWCAVFVTEAEESGQNLTWLHAFTPPRFFLQVGGRDRECRSGVTSARLASGVSELSARGDRAVRGA